VKIVTWNVNSLNARGELVGHFLDEEAPDVLAIQELKLDADSVPTDLFEARGYHVAYHAQKQWNGVLIASREPMHDVMAGLPAAEEGEARVIACTVGGVRLVNLYCPQGQRADSPKFAFKLRFFDALIAWLADAMDPSAPWIVLGDINIAPHPEDVWDTAAFDGVPTYHPLEHERWGRLVDLGLEDVVRPRIEPGTYTFWDYRGGAFYKKKGMRIDHVLATAPAASRVSAAWVERDWRKKRHGLTASDHAPVCVTLDT